MLPDNSTSGVIYACVRNTTGEIKIVGPGDACPRGYHLIKWNIQGPHGLKGDTGETGPVGPPAPESAYAVPSGLMILGDNPTAPPGYSYTGMTIENKGEWRSKGPFPILVNQNFDATHTAFIAFNDKIYAIRGNRTYEYDPQMDTWIARAPMPTPRDWFGAAALGDKIYVVGGFGSDHHLNIVEIYVPATDSWIRGVAPMPTARSNLRVAILNGKVYVIGGMDGHSDHLGTTEEYDPIANTWAEKGPLPGWLTSRTRAGSPPAYFEVASLDHRIYAVGGTVRIPTLPPEEIKTSAVYVYGVDPDWMGGVPMLTAHSGFGLVVLEGQLYAIGGDEWGPSVEAYDPVRSVWSPKTPMPTGRGGLGAAALSGKIYVFGGAIRRGPFSEITNDVLEYTPGRIFYIHMKN